MTNENNNSTQSYNYDEFIPDKEAFERFSGPQPGENAIDFKVTDLNGHIVRLSDFNGKTVVLETGSITCAMYARGVPMMMDLMRKYPNIVFLVLYVREAHPGEKIHEHTSFEEKFQLAKGLQKFNSEQRIILIDSLDGSAHKIYGSLPNMHYVINKKGSVIFRSDWATPEHISRILSEITSSKDDNKIYRQDRFKPSKPSPWFVLKVTLRGGWRASWDLLKGLPRIFQMHKNIYRGIRLTLVHTIYSGVA